MPGVPFLTHAPLQGTGHRPAVDQAGRGRQDRDHPDPGRWEDPGRGQGDPPDDEPVRRPTGADDPRLPAAVPGDVISGHGDPGRDPVAVSCRSGRPRPDRRRRRRCSRAWTRWPRSTSGTSACSCCCCPVSGPSRPAADGPRRRGRELPPQAAVALGLPPGLSACALVRPARPARLVRRVPGRLGVRRVTSSTTPAGSRARGRPVARLAGPGGPGGGAARPYPRWSTRREARAMLFGFTEYHLEPRMRSFALLAR